MAQEPQKRERPQAQEIDELAQEQPRVSLLDTLDSQLRGVETVSRLMLICNVDDKKSAELVEKFREWVAKEPQVTGVLAIMGSNCGLHFLEGPTRKIYAAMEHFQSFSAEDLAKHGDDNSGYLSNLRILYLGELYKARASMHWCSFSYTASKASAGSLGSEASDADRCFHAYKTLLVSALKVKDQIIKSQGENCNFADFNSNAPAFFRNWGETLVSLDDLGLLLSKDCNSLLNYAQFEEIFLLTPKLKLESDLLWPMPPPPVY